MMRKERNQLPYRYLSAHVKPIPHLLRFLEMVKPTKYARNEKMYIDMCD